ncbi:MAG: penicillin-binding protein 2 [Candidatus Bipolaricaulota bacterium]|nr:MAG: penicillin-binding protein 2 [Candidatus Bipolaricaulota bacterium]
MLVLAIAILVVLVGRLAQLQVIQGGQWRERARGIQEQTIELPPQRGAILDRNGLLLAVDVRAASIAIDGMHVRKPEELVRILHEELGLPVAELRERVLRESYFTWIARSIDLDVRDRIVARADAAGAYGLVVLDTWKRHYPQGTLAANLIGFVGIDGDGLEGLELLYDDHLRGSPGRIRVVRGRDGRTYSAELVSAPTPGLDLRLSLDARVQAICEREIDPGVSRFAAVAGFHVVLDPRTGELLAVAQSPRYDPNHFATSTAEERKNLAVTSVFEAGSTFKAFTALTALEVGAVSLGDRFNGDDGITVSGHVMHNASNVSFGTVSFAEVIEQSINTAMIRVAFDVGSEALHEGLSALGFGRLTGVDLPGEVAGILRPAASWVPLDLAAACIGQSVAVTGLQLACAFAGIAADGVVPVPRIAAASSPPAVALPPAASVEAAETVRGLLRRVVVSGTGQLAEVPGFDVAGKTGTAQKAIPGRGYVAGKYTSVFAGFLPADAPALVGVVVLDEVGTDYPSGGWTSAQIFRDTMSQVVTVLGLAPAALSSAP